MKENVMINQGKKIFDDLVKEKMSMINKLYESVDYNNLKFENVSFTKDVSFYEFMNFKELFDRIKNNQIMFNETIEKQKLFLNELNNVKIGKKTSEQKEMISNLENFYKSVEEVFNFFKDYIKMYTDAGDKAKQDKTQGTRLKILTPIK